VATGRLSDKFHRLLNMDRRKQRKKWDKIRSLLKKLKQRQKSLRGKLEKEKSPEERKQVRRHLKVLQVQRKKGIKLCKNLKC
jgi:hypothetical protein